MLTFWLAALEWFCKHACDAPRRVKCVQYSTADDLCRAAVTVWTQ